MQPEVYQNTINNIYPRADFTSTVARVTCVGDTCQVFDFTFKAHRG
jgi:hypothetical protein